MDDRLLKTHLQTLYAHARWQREAVGIIHSAIKELAETAEQGNPDCDALIDVLFKLDRAPFDQKTEKIVQAIDAAIQSLG